MKVEDLIALAKKKKEYDFTQRIKIKYLPYLDKCNMVNSIIEQTCYTDTKGKRTFRRNTQAMLFVFTMRTIELYTDLEYETSDVIKVYDKLMEAGIMNSLLSAIPEDELKMLKKMLDMKCEDEEINVHSLVSFLENKSEETQAIIESLSRTFENPVIQDKIAAEKH